MGPRWNINQECYVSTRCVTRSLHALVVFGAADFIRQSLIAPEIHTAATVWLNLIFVSIKSSVMSYQYPHQEILAQITLLTRTLPTFRRLQCAYRTFRVDAQHQFMIRQMSRRLKQLTGTAYHWELPSGRRDGLFIDTASAGVKMMSMRVNGAQHGKLIYHYTTGDIHIRSMYRDGKPHGDCVKYDQSGQVLSHRIYEHGVLLSNITGSAAD